MAKRMAVTKSTEGGACISASRPRLTASPCRGALIEPAADNGISASKIIPRDVERASFMNIARAIRRLAGDAMLSERGNTRRENAARPENRRALAGAERGSEREACSALNMKSK